MRFWIPILAVMGACSGDSDDGATDGEVIVKDGDTDDSKPPDTIPDDTDETGDTAVTVETADTGTTTVAEVDCANLLLNPIGSSLIVGGAAYHGLIFTDTGEVVGADGNSGNANLIQADYYGNASIYRPNVGPLEQLERLADGTIIAASFAGVSRIDTSGAITLLASIPNVYGIRLGPDGMIYAADWDSVHRVDPVLGGSEVWLDGGNEFAPKVLDFSHDLTKMYIGSIFADGKVWSVDLDSSYDPIGPPVVLAQTSGSWHDGLGVDVCGNIYVAEYNTSSMYRISPSGQVGTLFALSSTGYGHGVEWGNGVGGFLEDAIYIPQPYNGDTISEVLVEVPYRTYTGPVINLP